MRFSQEEALEFLRKAGVLHYESEEDLDYPEMDEKWLRALNMNDVWAWALADVEFIEKEELPEVARLFWCYGWCGILYFVSEKNAGRTSEFYDNNRFIEFVRHEETLRKKVPDDSSRAYKKLSYKIRGRR